MGQDVGTIDLTEVFRRFEQARQVFGMVQAADARRDDGRLTDYRFDHGHPGGHRGWLLANMQLSNGIEHIEALQQMLLAGVTPRAPWTLLRSVFESGFWGLWLLEPDDSATRRRRGLHLEVLNHKQRTEFYNTMFRHNPDQRDQVTADHPAHRATYEREAAALGTTWSELGQRIRVDQQLRDLQVLRQFEPDMRNAVESIWRSLSGMQHGYSYALMINGERQGEGKPIPGGEQSVVAIRDSSFVGAAVAAAMLVIKAGEQYVTRSTSTTAHRPPPPAQPAAPPRSRKGRRRGDHGTD